MTMAPSPACTNRDGQARQRRGVQGQQLFDAAGGLCEEVTHLTRPCVVDQDADAGIIP
ncbi:MULTISPECIES: hypothetical protein [Aeromonas]|uniref:hypothetical protein n=1 Tax=Aeromonas TaxID=642 RepID=UPI0022E3088D|nr:hypothetical protein [Aeromonas sp. QDB69]